MTADRRPTITHLRITHPFPLRWTFVAHLEVPADLTAAEADRLAEWVRTLAIDSEPDPPTAPRCLP